MLREEFGFGLNAPVEVVIDGDISSDLVSPVRAKVVQPDKSWRKDDASFSTPIATNHAVPDSPEKSDIDCMKNYLRSYLADWTLDVLEDLYVDVFFGAKGRPGVDPDDI